MQLEGKRKKEVFITNLDDISQSSHALKSSPNHLISLFGDICDLSFVSICG